MVAPTDLRNPSTAVRSRTHFRLFLDKCFAGLLLISLLLCSACGRCCGIFGIDKILLVLCTSATFVPGRGADDTRAGVAGCAAKNWFSVAEGVELACAASWCWTSLECWVGREIGAEGELVVAVGGSGVLA